MTLNAGYYKIILRMTFLDQKIQVGRTVLLGGAALLTLEASDIANAWWDSVAGSWRSLSAGTVDEASFDSVVCEELVDGGALGEYAIPSGERAGTRASGGSTFLPSFAACGVRLTVGTRATRPGQMRLPFLLESDVTLNGIGAAYQALARDVALEYTDEWALPAPAFGVALQNVVVRYEGTPPAIVADQRIIGAVVNPYVTSQVSRKIGRGN